MRSPLLRVAVGLLILAACDKKKTPTEATNTIEQRTAPAAVVASPPAAIGQHPLG
ncbi:MAG: hypothetical protein U5K74_02025 [Gemmatimonadaceae bacterium]|nr:hypothetical protein [Gemmatimonadaceae bacterium]